jgi:hypothetical protein
MKHIDYTDTSRTGRTPAEWLPVGSKIAEMANQWSSRNDIVAFIGEGATEGLAPALFKPQIAEIEIDLKQTFGFGVTPEQVGDFTERSSRYEFPRATGAILHEAFHARFSRWSIERASKDLKQDEFKALMLLEEGRIEAQGLELDKNYRLFLRTSGMELALGEVELEKLTNLNTAVSAQLVGLVQARVIGGIFLEQDVAEVLDIVKTFLGDKVFSRLSEICAEFQQHKNHWAVDAVYPLAIEWAKIVREEQEKRGEPTDGGVGADASEQSESGEMSDALKELIGKLAEAKDDIELSSSLSLGDQQRDEEWKEEAEQRKSEAEQRNENRSIASEVFGQGTGEVAVSSTNSRLVEERTPTSAERSSAVIIARLLEQAKYRDRDVTVIGSNLPQGRLNTRNAIQNEAQKAQGLLPTADTWKRKVRKQTDEPTLTVGVMVDISGSMASAMQPMATTAWVMSEAVRRIQGKTAMIYYGQDVFPTLKKGQHLDRVKVFSANDPTEKFDKAFKALDGELNLLYGSGVRLLVVVSDGVYTDEETKKARRWVQECERNGVAILWLAYQSRYDSKAKQLCKGTNAVVLEGVLNPTEASMEIGRACAEALERATKKVA